MIFTNDVPSTNMRWNYVWDEFLELLDEIKKGNWVGIRDELCDVYTCFMCAIARYTDIPMPIFWMRSAKMWNKRCAFWQLYFDEVGLKFDPKYLRLGSNYKKAEKRRVAMDLAIEDQIK